MQQLKLHDKEFKVAIPASRIKEEVERLGREISHDLPPDSNPLFIAVLNGSFIFAADLLRQINFPCELVFIKVSSYQGLNSSGKVTEVIGLDRPIEGRTVVLIEDIVDSGGTIERLIETLGKQGPKEIKVATFLFKPEAYTRKLKIDYIGLSVENEFIVGYGLDYDGLGRNYPDIYKPA